MDIMRKSNTIMGLPVMQGFSSHIISGKLRSAVTDFRSKLRPVTLGLEKYSYFKVWSKHSTAVSLFVPKLPSLHPTHLISLKNLSSS